MGCPATLGKTGLPESLQVMMIGKVPRKEVIAPFSFAFMRLALTLIITTEAKMPMMAMTIKSSISVNPLVLNFIFIFFRIFRKNLSYIKIKDFQNINHRFQDQKNSKERQNKTYGREIFYGTILVKFRRKSEIIGIKSEGILAGHVLLDKCYGKSESYFSYFFSAFDPAWYIKSVSDEKNQAKNG
jgi:hypothetical protein